MYVLGKLIECLESHETEKVAYTNRMSCQAGYIDEIIVKMAKYLRWMTDCDTFQDKKVRNSNGYISAMQFTGEKSFSAETNTTRTKSGTQNIRFLLLGE